MRKGKSVVGKTILSLEEGAKLDKVSDVVIDPDGRHVVALVVTDGGFLSSSRVVPVTEVASFGKDAIVIRNAESIVATSDDPTLRDLVDRDEKILGKNVYTTTGDEHGSIADVYFEEATGQVVGYEVSNGVMGDAASGRRYLATDEIAAIGGDVIYVEPATAATLDAQVGGIQGAMEDAGRNLGNARQGAQQRVAQARPEDNLVGRRTGSDVETDTGSVIVPEGRVVRAEDVAAARDAGKLRELTVSVARGDAQVVREDAKDTLDAAGDQAGSLWDQFTAKLAEMTDANGRRIDAANTRQRLEQIADAIGRPVSKVILDRRDDVILNMGDIITHQAVQLAYESGGLDSLLSAVYKGDVTFTKDEMRAPIGAEAEATIDKASGGAAIVDELESKVDAAERAHAEEQERKRRRSDSERDRRERERDARATERQTRRGRSEPDRQEPVATPTR